jgi:cell division protein FtsX
MEKKENKTGAIIGTVAAILLCGLPGLFMFVLGITSVTRTFPREWVPMGYPTLGFGIVTLMLAVIGIAVAVLVPLLTLRGRKKKG